MFSWMMYYNCLYNLPKQTVIKCELAETFCRIKE